MESKEEKKPLRARPIFGLRICVTVVFALLIVIVVKINMQINDKKAELEKMVEETTQRQLVIEQLKADIARLPDNIEELDEETLKKIANEELNLRDSDIIIFANSQPN